MSSSADFATRMKRTQSWADRDVASRRMVAEQEDIEVWKAEAQEWVEMVLGIRFTQDFLTSLQSGVRLCQLLKKIDPSWTASYKDEAKPCVCVCVCIVVVVVIFVVVFVCRAEPLARAR